jgi:hypothetical protein
LYPEGQSSWEGERIDALCCQISQIVTQNSPGANKIRLILPEMQNGMTIVYGEHSAAVAAPASLVVNAFRRGIPQAPSAEPPTRELYHLILTQGLPPSLDPKHDLAMLSLTPLWSGKGHSLTGYVHQGRPPAIAPLRGDRLFDTLLVAETFAFEGIPIRPKVEEDIAAFGEQHVAGLHESLVVQESLEGVITTIADDRNLLNSLVNPILLKPIQVTGGPDSISRIETRPVRTLDGNRSIQTEIFFGDAKTLVTVLATYRPDGVLINARARFFCYMGADSPVAIALSLQNRYKLYDVISQDLNPKNLQLTEL